MRLAAGLRITWIAGALAAFAIAPFGLGAASLVHLRWDALSTVVGKTVSIAMPGGPVITGVATGVEPDALLIDVKRTTNAKAYPRGATRVPRATLRRFDIRTKGVAFRIVGTVLGSGVGLVGGVAAGWGIQGGILNNRRNAQAAGAFVGIWAGGTVAGYFAGNAVDTHWTPVEILP